MPASTRQRSVRQPASPAKSKACRQATMRAWTVREEIGGTTSSAAENAGPCERTAAARKRATTTGRSTLKAGHRGPHGSSSRHRGVTQHKRTKKWEAHLWDDRRQVYLGGFDCEEAAARAHDVMAMKCRGMQSTTNYDHQDYEHLLPRLEKLSKDDVRQLLMRKASSFSPVSSKSPGVTKHKSGRWEARLGQTRGRQKSSCVGLFDSEIEAARACDMATVDKLGPNASTNYSISDYAAESWSDAFGRSGDLAIDREEGLDGEERGRYDNDTISCAFSCLEEPKMSDQYTAGLLDFPSSPVAPLLFPQQTLDSFPLPSHDSFLSPFSVGSLDLPNTHMGPFTPAVTTTHMGSPNPHHTLHPSSYSSADTPIFDPNPLPRGPVGQAFGLHIPLSRSDQAFQWCQVDPSPSDSPNQPFVSLQDMQAFTSAQPTSASKWPDNHSTFFSVELTAAGDRESAKLASDRELTQAQVSPQTQRRTQTQTQTESRKYMDEVKASLFCRAQPAKLAADMQKLLHNSRSVHGPQELQQRIESTDSQITRYKECYRPQELKRSSGSFGSRVSDHTDWYRRSTSPAASAEEGHDLATLGAKLTSNGFGGYGSARAGAQGLLAAGRAAEDLSGQSCNEQPSTGLTNQSAGAAYFRGRDKCTSVGGPGDSLSGSPMGTELRSASSVPCLSSPRQQLFMANFGTLKPACFASWAKDAMQRAHSSYARRHDGGW